MEQRRSNRILGLILFTAGVIWAGKVLEIFRFSIFFPGWWTLFIIIPSVAGLSSSKSRGSSVIGLMVGIMLLLWRLGFIPGGHIPGMLVALIFVLIGISIMSGSSQKEEQKQEQYQESYTYSRDQQSDQSYSGQEQYSQKTQYGNGAAWGANDQTSYETCPPHISAILAGRSVSCLNGLFNGTSIQAILGNIQLDLRQALIERDVYVNVNLVLGGADIYLPENVRVICEARSILGDVRDVRRNSPNEPMIGPTIHITGNCILGGLELK